jgi:hypothetical protein
VRNRVLRAAGKIGQRQMGSRSVARGMLRPPAELVSNDRASKGEMLPPG